MNKLICPVCFQKENKENELLIFNKSYKCIKNHSFDISKENYVNLLNSKTNAGDNQTLISARYNFLLKDYYKPLRDKIKEIVDSVNIKTLIDCGCGTGYYLEEISKDLDFAYGFDISKDAIKIASKKHNKYKKITYFVSSSNNIPIKSNSFDCLLSVFAPYFNDEFNRIIKNNGYLIVISSDENHLIELKKLIYDYPYLNDHINKQLDKLESFNLIRNTTLTYKVNIPNEDLNNLFMMTPYYYKTKESDYLKLKDIDNLLVTISFNIKVFTTK